MYEATKLLSSSSNLTQEDIRLLFMKMFAKLDYYKKKFSFTNSISNI